MLLRHPQVASLDCGDCGRFLYDIDTGEAKLFPAIGGDPIPRPANVPTPCVDCAKCRGSKEPSPEVGRKATLSRKNLRTLDLYYRVKAGAIAADSLDHLAARNLGIIEAVMQAHQLDQQRAMRMMTEARIRAGV